MERWRDGKGVTELAEVGVHRNTVNEWIRGKYRTGSQLMREKHFCSSGLLRLATKLGAFLQFNLAHPICRRFAVGPLGLGSHR
jgi:hypothetical protein